MRRLTRALALTCMFMIATVAAITAQSSASEHPATRTVAIPGAGVAVTLPATWRIWPAEQAGHPTEIWATDVAAGATCNFSLMKDVASAEAAAHDTVQTIEAHPHHEIVGRTFLNVPTGNAVRVSYRLKGAPDAPRTVLHEYYLTAPDGVVSAYCAGDEPPADLWLSVIEAIASLSADPPVSALFDPRVEVPDHGFAVHFGAEWLVRAWPGPGPVLGGANVLHAFTPAQEDGSGGYECLVEDDTGLAGLPDPDSLDAWRETLVSSAEAQKKRTSEPVVTAVALPSGPAVRADWQRWRDGPATAWVFLDGDRRAALLCRLGHPPEDRWLAIAETFEFLPAEQ